MPRPPFEPRRRVRPAQYEPMNEGIGDAHGLRIGSTVAAEVAAATEPGALSGLAQEHAQSMVAAALTTLERLANRGWRTVAGDGVGAGRASRRGHDAVAERTEAFDPFESQLGPRG
jgi:hypothetical protein